MSVREYSEEVEISHNLALEISGMRYRYEVSEGAAIYRRSGSDWSLIGKAGYSINLKKRVVYWLDLVIKEQWRRQGFGGEVYRWLEEYLIRKYRVQTIFLIFPEEDSYPFWESIGFVGNRKELPRSH